jgi:hypothetical protein
MDVQAGLALCCWQMSAIHDTLIRQLNVLIFADLIAYVYYQAENFIKISLNFESVFICY